MLGNEAKGSVVKPSIGRIVTAVGFLARSNGTDEAPAIITRVWGEHPDGGWTVNATIFRDNAAENCASSVVLFDNAEAARTSMGSNELGTALHWPERVA